LISLEDWLMDKDVSPYSKRDHLKRDEKISGENKGIK
jgi:hypothetical protein